MKKIAFLSLIITMIFLAGCESLSAPTVTIENVVADQDSITFDITVMDTDTVGEITSIELYQGETLIEALSDLTVREFTGLLSNNEYQIAVTYTYDLDDGNGEQEVAATHTESTKNYIELLDSITLDLSAYASNPNFGLGSILDVGNGELWIVGNIFDWTDSSMDAMIISINSSGEINWTRTYGGFEDDAFTDGVVLSDGTIVLGGYSASVNGDFIMTSTLTNSLLVKLDSLGNIIEYEQVETTSWDWIVNIEVDSVDNLYILTREGVKKYSDELSFIWEQDLNVNNYSNGMSDLQIASDDTIYVSYNYSDNIYISKLNDSGTVIWTNDFGGSKMDSVIDIDFNNDGNLLLTGYTKSYDGDITTNSSGSQELLFMVVSPSGELLLAKTYFSTGNYADIGETIFQINNQGYILLSRESDYLYAYYFNVDFELIEKTYLGTSTIKVSSCIVDGNIVLVTENWNSGIVIILE